MDWKPLRGWDRGWNCGEGWGHAGGWSCAGGGNSGGNGRSGAGALVQGSQGGPGSCGGSCPLGASRIGDPLLPRLCQAGNPASARECHRHPQPIVTLPRTWRRSRPGRLRERRRPHGTLPRRPGYSPVTSMMLRNSGLHRAIHCISSRSLAVLTFRDRTNSHCAGTGSGGGREPPSGEQAGPTRRSVPRPEPARAAPPGRGPSVLC